MNDYNARNKNIKTKNILILYDYLILLYNDSRNFQILDLRFNFKNNVVPKASWKIAWYGMFLSFKPI